MAEEASSKIGSYEDEMLKEYVKIALGVGQKAYMDEQVVMNLEEGVKIALDVVVAAAA